MRISNVSQFFPGANVNAFEYRQGESEELQITWQSGGSAVNLTGYTITAITEYMTADVETSTNRSGGSDITLSNVTLQTSPSARALTTSITDATSGVFEIQIPANLYAATVAPDATTGVPMAVTYVTVNDGASSPTADQIVLLHIIRRGLITAS